MKLHHRLAVIACAGLSAIALTDAVVHGLTGHYSMFADDSGNRVANGISLLIHGVAYLALALVLHREAARFTTANWAARLARRILLVAFTALGIGMIVAQPVVLLFAIPMDGPSGVILGIVGTLLLLTLAVGTLVLSLAVLRNNPLGIGGRVLGAMLPVLALTVLIGLLAPGWAHPGYVETVINFGIALIGVRAAEPRRFPEVTVTRGKDAVYFS